MSSQKVLLVVDDNEVILRMLYRVLKRHFASVFTSNTPIRAERYLNMHPITDVVCDYNLGDSAPRGTDLLAKWRELFPSIQKAIIYTGSGSEDMDTTPTCIDAVLEKGRGH